MLPHDSINVPQLLHRAIPTVAGHGTVVPMHNDAVVQGLSGAPSMRDVERWSVMTIGAGLGNARLANRTSRQE